MAALNPMRPHQLGLARISWIAFSFVVMSVLAAALLLGTEVADGRKPAKAAPPQQHAAGSGSLEGIVRDKLSRGVSLSFWFTHRDQPELSVAVPAGPDFALIRKLGLKHVRVMFDPAWLSGGEPFAAPNETNVEELADAVQTANDAGLLFVLVLQPTDEVKPQLVNSDDALAKAQAIWRRLATRFQSVPADQLIFEVLNEPGTEDAERSRTMQEKLVAAVREVSKDRIVAVAGAHFSDIDDLVLLRPLDDSRVLYSFHFYEPHNFTHQGAAWGWPMWQQLHDLPYPSSPALLDPVLDKLSPEAVEHAAYYGQQNWNKRKLAEIIDRASAWGKRNGVPVWCSEFGVLRDVTPPASRQRWLTDVRQLFEERGIAWTHFDWWGHFGLVTGDPAQRQTDEIALAGLNLKRP